MRALKIFGGMTVVFGLALLSITVVFTSYYVPTRSMEPSISADTHVLVERFGSSAKRGSIVVVTDTRPGGFETIMRIVALGGDHVESIDGVLHLNGSPLDEPYLALGAATMGVEATTVPDGEMYLLGDNRPISFDSRRHGPVAESQLIGEVWTGHPRWHLIVLVALALSLLGTLIAFLRWRPAKRSAPPVPEQSDPPSASPA